MLWHSRPMAQKATVCKAAVQIADIDRGVYGDHAVTLGVIDHRVLAVLAELLASLRRRQTLRHADQEPRSTAGRLHHPEEMIVAAA